MKSMQYKDNKTKLQFLEDSKCRAIASKCVRHADSLLARRVSLKQLSFSERDIHSLNTVWYITRSKIT